jgi:CheR methyltransferase, SAM binding domain
MSKPAALRPVCGQSIGTTAFFRNRAFSASLIELLSEAAGADAGLRILFHSCSVGAEPYSFAMEARLRGLDQRFASIAIDATDIEPSFIETAKAGVYGIEVLRSVPPDARRYLVPGPTEDSVRIAPRLAEAVRFLPAASFSTFKPEDPYDVVLALNSLTYVSSEEQKKAICRMASYTRRYLCITAFDPDIIRPAIDAAGFLPVRRHWRAIYYGWGNRLRLKPARRGTQKRSWVLPYVPLYIRDRAYKVCSIFERAMPWTPHT